MKILTSPSSFGQIATKPLELLTDAGFEIINNPFGRKLTEDEVIDIGKECVGIVAGVESLSVRVIDALPNLKCISRVGIGMDNIDLNYASQKGIVVKNTPDGPTRAVAELTLGMTLALLRKIPQAHYDLKNRVWKKQTGNLILDKIIGVVGLGRIGKSVSQLFKGIGNAVVGYDPYADKSWALKHGVQLTDFETLLKTADIITIHIPGNEDNSAVVGAKEIDLIKTGAFLVNMSRGGVMDENSLYIALSEGKLSGAAIDVFSEEPYRGRLIDLDNVVLTPHLGSYAEEGKLLMEIDAVNNLIDALR
jgi:D-3-phosphoglycerate dehydrogenase